MRNKPLAAFLTLSIAAALVLSPMTGSPAGALVRLGNPPPGTRVLAGQTPGVVAQGVATVRGQHDPNALLTLAISLAPHDTATLNTIIAAAADPTSPQYGRYLTPAQYMARFAPTDQEVQAVRDWVQSAGLSVETISPDHLLVLVRGTTSQVEQALGVTLDDYSLSGHTFMANDHDPAVPAGLDIQAISGLSTLAHARSLLARSDAFRGGGYYPNDLRTAYNMGPVGDGSGQTIGFTLWGAPLAQSDLNTFASRTGTPTIVAGQAGNDGIDWIPVSGITSTYSNDLLETALDVEYAHGAAPHSHLKYWLATDDTDTPGLELALDDAAHDPTVHVVSNSWGMSWGSAEPDPNDPDVTAMNTAFQYAASVGTTFYFSSGDGGYASGASCDPSSDASCIDDVPSFPADSPYVVSVGGTSLRTGSSFAYQSETAWNGSGGGCSTRTFPARPVWQIGASAATCSGRAEPDIAADADPNTGVWVYEEGGPVQVGGTSLAAPLWAGMSADLNRYLGAAGRPPMGFAAPRLYALATNPTTFARDFHDVTVGNNDPSGGSDSAYAQSAGAGWDEVTGWGSPNAANLAADWVSAPMIAFNPGSVAFATQPVSTSSSAQTVTLLNTSSLTVTLTAALSGTNPGDFNLDGSGCTTSPLPPSGSCAVSIGFAPTAAGRRSASIVVHDASDAGDPDATLPLSGTAVYAQLGTSRLSFGRQLAGTTSSPQTVSVTNKSGAPMTVTAATGASAFSADASNCANVAAGASCAISVTFTPPANGAYSDVLTVQDNLGDPAQKVALDGTGYTVPTNTPTPLPTTPAPTSTATNTPLPTSTATNTAAVPAATATATSTSTPVPPTNTPPPTSTGTSIPATVSSPTATSVPPTVTPLPHTATPVPTTPVATATSRPPATATHTSTPAPSATPTATPIPSATAQVSVMAMATATPSPVKKTAPAPPVGKARATATATPVSSHSHTSSGSHLSITVRLGAHGSAHAIASGSRVPLTVSGLHAREVATLAVSLRLLPAGSGSQPHAGGRGRQQRTHMPARAVVYRRVARLQAGSHGRVTAYIHLTYAPAKPVRATLAVQVHTRRGTATRSLRVSLTPRPSPRCMRTGAKGKGKSRACVSSRAKSSARR